MHSPEPAETAVDDDLAKCSDVGIEPTVLINPENDPLRLGSGVEFARAFGGRRERLVGDNVKSSCDSFKHERAPGLRVAS